MMFASCFGKIGIECSLNRGFEQILNDCRAFGYFYMNTKIMVTYGCLSTSKQPENRLMPNAYIHYQLIFYDTYWTYIKVNNCTFVAIMQTATAYFLVNDQYLSVLGQARLFECGLFQKLKGAQSYLFNFFQTFGDFDMTRKLIFFL